MQKEIIIVGGGLVGSLMAVMMSKKGHKVKVMERRPDIRKAEISAGKSINLALSDRGWKALRIAEAEKEIEPIAIPMKGRLMHATNGEITFQPYGLENQAIYSVSRGDLNARLLDIADRDPNVEIYFNQRCLDVDSENGEAYFEDVNTGEKTSHKADLIFGSDGAFSAVRLRLQKTDRFDFEQRYLTHGYRELLLPSGPNGEYLLDKNALHIWPRESFMLIALPNEDGSFTCTLFMAFEGDQSFEQLKTDADIRTFFESNFPDFTRLMPDVVENYKRHPLSSMVIIKCYPWTHGKAVLIGDAAHAIVPFYGQGMNAGFEDCTVMWELMEKHGDDWDTILDEYQKLRKPDGDAICELALKNYIEMRDLVADDSFLLRKKIEKRLLEHHPEKWMPLYSMVTFSDLRYSEALNTGKKQAAIMDKIMQEPGISERWDSEEVEKKILEML